ncbi:mucin-12-like isoform X1 [Acropora muricata]|uniref:mucin-12-like isoform X1 n=2 Tax=Acropora muricata TaxID=159855 RepID=UPI0034E499DE
MTILQLCLFAFCSVAFAECSYVFSNHLSFLGGNFNVSYNFNASSDTLEFFVEVRTTGWVGFGFAEEPSKGMMNYDVAVGGVFKSGSGYLTDYFTNGFRQPPEDTQQDWTLKNATEMNGITALKFCRQRNTSDAQDVAVEPGMPIFLIMAYHGNVDASAAKSIKKHRTRGFKEVTLIPAVATTTTPMATTTSTSAMAVSMATSVHTDVPISDKPTLVATSTTIAAEMSSSMKGKSTMVVMDPSTAFPMVPTMALVSDKPALAATSTTIAAEMSSSMKGKSTMVVMDPSTAFPMVPTMALVSDKPALAATSTTIAAEISSSVNGKPTTTAMDPLTASSAVSASPTSTPAAVSNFISFDGGKYNVSWMFNSSMDTFHFVVKVRATGWIGFGLATQAPNGMSGYDVAVSGTNNGTKYLKDYFTSNFAAPPQDAQQDWMLSYFSEEQNVTTLKFYRKRDTNDTANDIAIQPGQSYYFIWAYHASDTVTQGRFPKHSFSGSYQVDPLIPSIQPTTTASTASTESPTTPGTALPTQTPFPYAFDDNKFFAMWRFDDQADKIHVHLRVKTTGWIGFGFAQTAPNDMRDYDVIVGGFSNGRGYLWDYKTMGRMIPTLDARQDYTLLNASEAGGYTQLIFERPRDTGDENDFAFTRGSEVFIIWGYSDADITDKTNFGRHSSKGWSSKKYILVAENQPIPTEAKATALYSSFAIALSIALFHVLL